MNSNYGKSSKSINAFDFDLGLGSAGPRSLNDQKNKSTSSSYNASSYSSTAHSRPNATSSWTHQPSTKPSWTHQPANPVQSTGSLSGPTSMVGDIFGKSWGSGAPPSSSTGSIGVVNNKNPNLFGDLVSSAIGQNKGNSNVPLKNAAPSTNKSSFSMGGMTDSLPKAGSTRSWGSTGDLGGGYAKSSSLGSGNVNVNVGGNVNRNQNLGAMKSGGGMGSNKDPFGSLVDFSAKTSGSMNSSSKVSNEFSDFQNAGSKASGASNANEFGDFQNAGAKTSGGSFTSSSAFPSSNFEDFQNAGLKASGFFTSANAFASSNSDPLSGFGFSTAKPQAQAQVQNQPSGTNDFGVLFHSSSNVGGSENEGFTGGGDWGVGVEFGGGEEGTTELEGLPPPPAGVSAATAKSKGMDNHKQGQYADAIKWLSWAVVLLEKAGDDGEGMTQVLSSRASCYKEVGEYKKAVADCTKVLEHDDKNVSVLVQRALLYESMEKYKLGAEDLRTVMKLDPLNRVARSTIHRLTKMAD